MAQASKNRRKMRRLKRSLSLYEQRDRAVNLQQGLQQQLQMAQAESYAVRVGLYTILAQKGGEVEVTIGTMKQVLENMRNLSINQEPKKDDEQTLIIRLVEQAAPVTEQAVTETIPEEHFPVADVGADMPGGGAM
jgi:hypothetical protein